MAFAAAIVVGSFVQNGTAFGVSTLAIGANQRAARLSGHRVRFVKMMAYFACATCAGIAGVIQASQVHTAAATYGMGVELDVIAAVVVGGTALTGGTGGAVNTVIGALILSVMENGMNVVGVDAYFQQSILGIVIIVSVALTFDRSKTAMIK